MNQMDRLLAGPIFNPDLTQPYYEHLRRYSNRELPEVGDVVEYVSLHPKMHPTWHEKHVVTDVRIGFGDFAGMTHIWVKGETYRSIEYRDPRKWRLVRRAEAES